MCIILGKQHKRCLGEVEIGKVGLGGYIGFTSLIPSFAIGWMRRFHLLVFYEVNIICVVVHFLVSSIMRLCACKDCESYHCSKYPQCLVKTVTQADFTLWSSVVVLCCWTCTDVSSDVCVILLPRHLIPDYFCALPRLQLVFWWSDLLFIFWTYSHSSADLVSSVFVSVLLFTTDHGL